MFCLLLSAHFTVNNLSQKIFKEKEKINDLSQKIWTKENYASRFMNRVNSKKIGAPCRHLLKNKEIFMKCCNNILSYLTAHITNPLGGGLVLLRQLFLKRKCTLKVHTHIPNFIFFWNFFTIFLDLLKIAVFFMVQICWKQWFSINLKK